MPSYPRWLEKARNVRKKNGSWAWEVAALMMSITSLLAIIIVAGSSHGKVLPLYPLGITLNAAISIFSTIMKTTMLYCAAEAINQSKWIWLHRQPQRLSDIELYDQASRGPWGSLTMLWRVRWKDLSSLAALVIIYSLAIDPFVQQLTHLRLERVVADLRPSITVQWVYLVPNIFSTQSAVIAAFFGSTMPETPAVCPSGNCSWSPYQTLAVCSQCVDISDQIHIDDSCFKFKDAKCAAYLMNGLSVDFGLTFFGDIITNTTGTGTLLSIENVGWGPSLINFTKVSIGYVSDDKKYFRGSRCFFKDQATIAGCLKDLRTLLAASECTLHWCVNRYSATQRSGVLKEDYIDSWWSDSGPKLVNGTKRDHHRYMQLVPSIGDGVVGMLRQNLDRTDSKDSSLHITRQIPNNYRACYVELEMHNSLSRWLTKFFTTTSTFASDSTSIQNDGETPDTAIVLSGVKDKSVKEGTPLSDPVFDVFSNVAHSLTQSVRLNSGRQIGYDEQLDIQIDVEVGKLQDERSLANVTANSTVLGAMFEDHAIVRVRWGWLAFPVALVGMTALLTISTKIKSTRKHLPVWSSSTTALMMRGPYSRIDDMLLIADSARAMQRKADQTKVVLRRGANKCWKISEQESPASRSNSADSESAASIAPNPTIHGVTNPPKLKGTDDSLTVNTILAATEPERKEQTLNIFDAPPSVRHNRSRSI
ncbi:MAG: hypothetical protein Q9213_005161 [Squamulea squamosa]